MSVLLVNPFGLRQGWAFDIPTNLLYLYSALRNAGVDVDLADGNMIGLDGVKTKILEMKPSIVGISCISPVRFTALDIAQFAKERVGAKVVMGNHHAHWMHEQILNTYPFVDACALGEGEETIVSLAQSDDWKTVKGLATRYYGKPSYNIRGRLENLDDIAFPAWDAVDLKSYKASNALGPRVYYSRGCFAGCKFCNSPRFWKGYRFRSVNNFCDEIEWLHELGMEWSSIGDDLGTYDESVALFTEMLNRKGRIAIPFNVTTRSDCVTDDLCRLMAEVGVQSVAVGVESGSQRMLDSMCKGITVEQSRQAMLSIRKYGMASTALIITGAIGETPADREATNALMREVRPTEIGTVGSLWLFPDTKWWDEIRAGKYDSLIRSGKELVDYSFYLDPRWAQHVLSWNNGNIIPVRVTEC